MKVTVTSTSNNTLSYNSVLGIKLEDNLLIISTRAKNHVWNMDKVENYSFDVPEEEGEDVQTAEG